MAGTDGETYPSRPAAAADIGGDDLADGKADAIALQRREAVVMATTSTAITIEDIESLLRDDTEGVTVIEASNRLVAGCHVTNPQGFIVSAQVQLIDNRGGSVRFVPERCEGEYEGDDRWSITATWSRQIGTGEWPTIQTAFIPPDATYEEMRDIVERFHADVDAARAACDDAEAWAFA